MTERSLQKFRKWINAIGFRESRLELVKVDSNIPSSPELFTHLSNGKVDLILVKDLLSHKQQQSITQLVDNGQLNVQFFSFGKGSAVFPLPYSMMSNRFYPDNEILSLLSAVNVQSKYLHHESFSAVTNLIFRELELMCGPLDTLPISGVKLCPLNLRVFSHECEGTTIHSENSFLDRLYRPLKDALTKSVDGENALSFFCAIRTPSVAGGKLQLFTENFPSAVEIERNEVADFQNRNELTARSGIIIPIASGDMVIFRGAKLFHQITPVFDKDETRVSIGGFIARNRTSGKWIIWS